MIDPKHLLALRDRIIADRGWLMLLALSEREGWKGRPELLIAGGGLGWGGLDDYKYVADVMKQELSRDEILTLTTFVLIRETNEWLQKLVERVRVENGEPVELRDVEFGDVEVRRAFIFHAQPAEVGAARA
jgi:hypothetical protein